MKRSSYTIIAVTFLLVMCCPNMCGGVPSLGKRRGKKTSKSGRRKEQNITKYKCSIIPGNEYFVIRGACQESGFITVTQNKVLQMSDHSNSSITTEGVFIRETCTDLRETSSSIPLVRYRHNQSSKYICFSRSGRARMVNSRLVDRKRKLCMFREKVLEFGRNSSDPGSIPDSGTVHTIQSAHKKEWLLGFHSRRGVKLPRRGVNLRNFHLKVVTRKNNMDKCGFLFHSKTLGSLPGGNNYKGLFNLIDEVGEGVEENLTGYNAAAHRNNGEKLKVKATTTIPSTSWSFWPFYNRRERSLIKRVRSRMFLDPSVEKRPRKLKNLRKRYGMRLRKSK